MDVTAEYLGNLRFEVQARGHRLISDQPVDNGGSDTGPTPPEFLLASLASCAAYYAAQYLNARRLPSAGLRVRVSAQKAQQPPARLASFKIEVEAPGLGVDAHDQADRHQAGLLRAVKTCLIHNTLLGNPAVEVVLATPVAAPAH